MGHLQRDRSQPNPGQAQLSPLTLLVTFVTSLTIVAATAVGMWISPASAHSSLIETSPGFDQTAGGAIDGVELAFNEPVTDALVTVSYNGEPLPGVTAVTDGMIIRFELNAPLSVPGRYEVSYELISFDADRTTNTFFFTYDADAPAPVGVGLSSPEGATESAGGRDWVLIGTTASFLLGLFALLGAFVWRTDGKRQRERMI